MEYISSDEVSHGIGDSLDRFGKISFEWKRSNQTQLMIGDLDLIMAGFYRQHSFSLIVELSGSFEQIWCLMGTTYQFWTRRTGCWICSCTIDRLNLRRSPQKTLMEVVSKRDSIGDLKRWIHQFMWSHMDRSLKRIWNGFSSERSSCLLVQVKFRSTVQLFRSVWRIGCSIPISIFGAVWIDGGWIHGWYWRWCSINASLSFGSGSKKKKVSMRRLNWDGGPQNSMDKVTGG